MKDEQSSIERESTWDRKNKDSLNSQLWHQELNIRNLPSGVPVSRSQNSLSGMLYAITVLPDQPEFLLSFLSTVRGVDNSKLSVISHNGLMAIFGETVKGKAVANTENVLMYATVIEAMFRNFTVLPVRYGTLMDSEKAVIALLEKYGKAFKQNLSRLENKEELSLKVLWDPQKGNDKIRQQLQAYRAVAPFTGNSVSKEYLLRKLKEHQFENALQSYVKRLVDEIGKLVIRFNTLHQFKKMVSETIILDAVFLLEKGQKKAFTQAIEQLRNKHESLHFFLTGPWPPYSFVELNINQKR